MFERTRILIRLYRQALPKDHLRKKVFIASQLILFTGVPVFTLCQIIGGICVYPALVYLMVLLFLTARWSEKMTREFFRTERALQVAEKLRGESDDCG